MASKSLMKCSSESLIDGFLGSKIVRCSGGSDYKRNKYSMSFRQGWRERVLNLRLINISTSNYLLALKVPAGHYILCSRKPTLMGCKLFLSGHFTTSEPKNQSIDGFYIVQKSITPELEALKLLNVFGRCFSLTLDPEIYWSGSSVL